MPDTTWQVIEDQAPTYTHSLLFGLIDRTEHVINDLDDDTVAQVVEDWEHRNSRSLKIIIEHENGMIETKWMTRDKIISISLLSTPKIGTEDQR